MAPEVATDAGRRQFDDGFLDLVLADPDLLEAEFAAVTSALRPLAPPLPADRAAPGADEAGVPAGGEPAPGAAGPAEPEVPGREARSPPPGRS